MSIRMISICVLPSAPHAVARITDSFRRIHLDHRICFDSSLLQSKPDYRIGNIHCEGGDERVVRVQTQDCLRCQADSLADCIECMHDFSIAVKLVTEEISNHDNTRFQQRGNMAQCPLIALNDRKLTGFPVCICELIRCLSSPHRPPMKIRRRCKLRRHPRQQVGSGPIT